MASVARFRAALVLLTLGAFALRVHGLGTQSFWLDEVDAVAMAGAPVAAQLRKLTAIGENGPLYFLLFKAWLTLAGTSEFGARALSALASTLAVPLLGVFGLRLFHHRPTALIAAALGGPLAVLRLVRPGRQDVPPFAALALGAQYAFLRAWGACRRAGRAGPGCVVGGVRALLVVRPLRPPLRGPADRRQHGRRAVLWPRRPGGRPQPPHRPRRWRGFVGPPDCSSCPTCPWPSGRRRCCSRGRDVGYRPTPLPAIVVALLEQLTWHLNPSPPTGASCCCSAPPCCGGCTAPAGRCRRAGCTRPRPPPGRTRRPARPLPLLLAIWLLVPVALTVLLQGTVPVFRDRYLIPLLAPLLLLLARAMSPPWAQPPATADAPVIPADAPAGNLLGPVVALFVAAGFGYGLLNRPPNPDFRAAAALVHAQAAPGEPVGFLAGYAARPFDYYYEQRPGHYEKVQLPYTNDAGLSESDGLRAVATSLRGGRWLWVVRFEDWLWDERDLTGRYLEARGAAEVLRRDFDGVSVSRYELFRPATG